jgi:hypothetical protein
MTVGALYHGTVVSYSRRELVFFKKIEVRKFL